jgi:hypothetical protein
MTRPPEHIVERTAPLCWSQEWYWLATTPLIRKGGPSPLFKQRMKLPTRVPLAVFSAVVAALVARHETLRTLYRQGEDGEPMQLVCQATEPELTVLAAGPDARAAAEDAMNQLPDAIDLALEFPLHVTVAVRDGEVIAAALAVHHIAVDGAGLTLLLKDYAELLAAELAGRKPQLRPQPWQPADQALSQLSGPAQAASQRALGTWARVLEACAHSTLPTYPDGLKSDTRMFTTRLVSRALARHCETAARRYRVTVPAVLHTVVAVLMSAWTGNELVAFDSVSSMRWAEPVKSSVGRYANGVRVPVDLSGNPPFSELARRVMRSLLTSYRQQTACDGAELVMVGARESARRGARVSASVGVEYHNYLSSFTRGKVPGEDPLIDQSIADGTYPFMLLNILPSQDTLTLSVTAPGYMLAPERGREFVRELARLAEAAAEKDNPRYTELDCAAAEWSEWRGPNWVNVRGARINTAFVARLIEDHPAVAAAAVFADSDKGLAAYAAVCDARVRPEDLGAHVRAEGSYSAAAMVPHFFTLVEGVPEDPSSREDWDARPVLDRGEPRSDERPAPENENESMLATAFRSLHPKAEVRMSSTYAELGGSFVRIPALLAALHDAGFEAPSLDQLIGVHSLRQIAGSLVRRATSAGGLPGCDDG